MKTLSPVWLTAVALLSFNSLASAEKLQLPRQGTANYTTYYTTRSLASLEMEGSGSASLIEAIGVTRNTDGQKFFSNMSVRCMFYHQLRDAKSVGNGACTETDADGDKVFSTFDAGAGVHTLIGGTGKYMGISGTASFTQSPLSPPGPDLGAVIVEHKLAWQFK